VHKKAAADALEERRTIRPAAGLSLGFRPRSVKAKGGERAQFLCEEIMISAVRSVTAISAAEWQPDSSFSQL
jgi:hypothetical protein